MKIMKKSKERGITLIALVVTIIILLILASIAITSVTGNNGLFKKAREATNMYKDAEKDEQGVLGEAENELSKLLNPNGTGGGSAPTGYVKGNTKVDATDGTYYIPDGFKLAEDSGTTINEGIVVEDKNGNQWVWIPCCVEGGVGSDIEGAVKYDKYIFQEDLVMFDEDKTRIFDEPITSLEEAHGRTEHYEESLDQTDEASIRQFGGYYIGRYEAGDKESTIAKEMRTEEKYANPSEGNSSNFMGDATHTVTIKKCQAPYNYVTYEQCETLSTGIANANNYDTSKMYTKLCSSYAWDTALMFIGGDYGTNSSQGNYKDTTFSYTDILGERKTKEVEISDNWSSGGTLVPTGQTSPIKNIYDMGGNVYEFTSEYHINCDLYTHYSIRGGSHMSKKSIGAGLRTYGDYVTGVDAGFRPTLYLSAPEAET